MVVSPRLPAFGAPLAAAALLALSQLAIPSASAAEPAFLKDLNIRQRAMVDVAPPSLPSAGTSTAAGAGIVVNTAVDRSDARYRHGDSLTLSVDVNEDVYVWVFDTGTSGKVHQIFPNRHDADNFVRAGKPIAIPRKGAEYQLLVSHPKGAELLTVIASKDSNPLTRDLIDNETQAGPFLALRGDSISVAKDLGISLKKSHPKWVGHHQVIHIE